MHRGIRTVLIIALVAIVPLAALSCGRNEVSVRSGLRVLCKYDHVVKDTTRYIKVDASRAKGYGVIEETTVCAAHRRAEQLYAQAKKALGGGDKAKAKAAFGKVVAMDPHFRDAGGRYKSLGGKVPKSGSVAKKSPSGGGSSGTGDGGPQGGGGGGTNGNGTYLSKIPASISPYRQVSHSEDILSGSRMFAARRSSFRVRLMTISVTWIGKKTKFSDWYRRRLAAKFSMDRGNVSVRGGTAYFGTDGSSLCNVCWARGGMVFQTELEARRGAPRGAKTEAVRVARIL